MCLQSRTNLGLPLRLYATVNGFTLYGTLSDFEITSFASNFCISPRTKTYFLLQIYLFFNIMLSGNCFSGNLQPCLTISNIYLLSVASCRLLLHNFR